MEVDIENLRKELKDEIDKILDKYLDQENKVLDIPEEKIYMEFVLAGDKYIAFTDDSKDEEEMNMMFAKVEYIDGVKILKNIEDEMKLHAVISEFYKRLELVAD